MEELKKLYETKFGEELLKIEKINGGGSNRTYYRLSRKDAKTLIGVVGTSSEENDSFCYLARHFHSKGLPVPEVYAQSKDSLRYIQEDLGTVCLFDALKSGREAGGKYSSEQIELIRRTIRLLPKFQVMGAEGLDFNLCYPQENFDRTNVLFDLNYFKYCFLKATGVDFNEYKLEQDFQKMADNLTRSKSNTFMYRDFQARNVMLDNDGNPYFIDFQGGRRGPVEYDLVSFLWQASALYPQSLRDEMIGEYQRALVTCNLNLSPWILFRMLQVIGAYGFRGYYEKKKHFIDSIPPAIQNLKQLLSDSSTCREYPYLRNVLEQLVNLKLNTDSSDYTLNSKLTVRVFSFSFKKGIPADTSGNGGGYVFDCRSTHNPGKYEQYKHLTGLDASVIKFLEDDGEILTFLESVYKLADAHVECYIQRGFTDLMFSFGCTGGQHRSVYSAQHLAEHLHNKYNIKVILNHREQGITQTL